jgi:3-oxoacyl-[acyl-carrier protein] reductase
MAPAGEGVIMSRDGSTSADPARDLFAGGAGLQGRTALVTGGTRGIGRAVAETLAAAGCRVAISARSAEDVAARSADLGARFGVPALGVVADVSLRAEVGTLFARLRDWSGGTLDVLVNNAGFPFLPDRWNTPLDATPPDQLESWYLEVFRTDALGALFCTYEALPLMIARGGGSLIYVSSTPALEGFQGAPYTVAKAALLGLMRDVAREYGPRKIRANALALGNIGTPATLDNLEPSMREAMSAATPLRRWGTPDEAARAVLFLASDLSSFITGQTLVVDGGSLRR